MKPKKRVAFLLTDRSGGVSQCIANAIGAYESDDIDFRVVLISDVSQPRPPATCVFRCPVRVVRYNGKLENKLAIYRRIRDCPEVSNATHVICNDLIDTCAIASASPGYSRILIIHGDSDFYLKLAQCVSDSFDKIICVGRHVAEKLARIASGSAAISHAAPPFNVCKKDVQNFSSLDARILFCGRLSTCKGYHDLASIDSELIQLGIKPEWTVIGEPQTSLPEDPWLGSPRVRHFHSLSNEQILDRMASCEIFCFPSRTEGFGLVVAEAISAGCFPVASELPSLVDITQNGRFGIHLPAGNIESWATTIAGLFRDKDDLNARRRECAQHAKESWCPNKLAKQFVDTCVDSDGTTRNSTTKTMGCSRLDARWIPNWLVISIRRLRAQVAYIRTRAA